MEQNTTNETLETSLSANLWAERLLIITILMVAFISIYAHLNLLQFFESTLIIFLFVGTFFLGFVAIAAHIKYYFRFEKHRKVELYSDRMVVTVCNRVTEQILKTDILRITLYDKRHIDKTNLFPGFLDPFYYLTVTGKNRQEIILTCLLDIRLKEKINEWYGQELKHIYQFFPFPGSPYH